jgi:hypothetical protein
MWFLELLSPPATWPPRRRDSEQAAPLHVTRARRSRRGVELLQHQLQLGKSETNDFIDCRRRHQHGAQLFDEVRPRGRRTVDDTCDDRDRREEQYEGRRAADDRGRREGRLDFKEQVTSEKTWSP